MFNIIETPRNYFTRDNLSSNVALHFSVSHWQPYLVVSCSEKVFCRPSTAPVSTAKWNRELLTLLVMWFIVNQCQCQSTALWRVTETGLSVLYIEAVTKIEMFEINKNNNTDNICNVHNISGYNQWWFYYLLLKWYTRYLYVRTMEG